MIVQNKPPIYVGDSVQKFGYNPDIDTTSDPEDVIFGGGTAYFPSSVVAAANIDIASDSSNDDGNPGGTGAQTLFIQGLDSNYMLQSETVTLEGTDNANPANDYLRIFRAYVVTSGTGGGR